MCSNYTPAFFHTVTAHYLVLLPSAELPPLHRADHIHRGRLFTHARKALHMSTIEQPLLTVQDVALLLATSERTIYRRVQDGTLPARRVGTTIRFNRTDLAHLLD